MRYLRLLIALTLFCSSWTGRAEQSLPTLGNTSSDIITLEKERVLGSAWLAALRGQVSTYDNPTVAEYLEQLVYNLAPNSEVSDRDFRFVVLNSSQLNAFAVPGSVIGINAGLFLHAGNEHEFASVMAHELAHLSQRHYARRLEKQEVSGPLTLAGVLTSVVVAATAGGEAGMAALASTQALSVEKSLSYSRQNEQEADRIGIETLAKSNYNPRSMPMMFERMLKNARLQGASLPEYLSTHPLSENRVADTRNRAEQYPRANYKDSLLFAISKAIVSADYAESKSAAADYFRSSIESGRLKNADAAQFGLAYALLDNTPKESLKIFKELYKKHPEIIAISVYLAEAEYLSGEKQEALTRLQQLLQFNPENYSTSLALAKLYEKEGQFQESASILTGLSRVRPDNPVVWYRLAEVRGLAGDIVLLHQARAKYFVLTSRFDQAIEQLELGIKKSKPNSQIASILRKQLDQAHHLKDNPPF